MPKGKKKTKDKPKASNKGKETTQELSLNEETLLAVAKSNPDMTVNQMCEKSASIRDNRSSGTFWSVYSRKEYIQRSIEEIKQNHNDRINRIQIPLAMKVTEKALKDKDLTFDQKHKWAASVYKAGLGDATPIPITQHIKIGTIQALIQTQVQGALDKEEDVIDVE